MNKRLALLRKLAQRSIARIPQSTRYGNLRFIKNLGGLPTVENGLTWLSPKTQYFANLTTDVPFRLHHNYHHIPGGEYMIINPDALRGIKPYAIDPMDTILKNSEALIDPKHITILSGNPRLLRQAKQQGFNIAITPELHAGYQRVLGEINAPTNPFDRKLHKTLSFGESGYAGQYRSAVDDFFTQLGRPTHQDYLRLERATGLPSHTIPFSQMQHNFNAGKAGVTWGNMSKPAFVYPDGREIIGTKILTRDLDGFYKNVGYNPTPTTEVDLLNQMGEFSKPHPTIFDIYPDTEKVFEQWRMLNVPGSLKNGGRIAKYQGAGWIGKGIKWLTTKGDDIVKSVQNTRAIKSFNKGITQSKSIYQFNPTTGSFDSVVEKTPFDYKFKHVKDLSDSEIKVLYDDLKTSGVITPEFEFAIGKQYNPYFTYSVKSIDPKDAFRVSIDLPNNVDVKGKRSPEIIENAIKEWFDVHYNPNRYSYNFKQLFPYIDQFSATPVNLQRILVDQALDASKSIDYVSRSMHANNFLKKGLSDFHVPSFKFTEGGLANSSNSVSLNQIELGFSPTTIVKEFDPDTKQWFKFSLPETMAHETAHSNTLFNTRGTNIKRIKTESPEYKMDYIFVPKRWKKLLSPSITKINTHDLELAEGYSDLWGMRKSMYDMGIGTKASFDPGVKYNYWDLFRYKMTPTGMSDRFIKQRGGWWGGWKQQLDALNEIYKNGGTIK